MPPTPPSPSSSTPPWQQWRLNLVAVMMALLSSLPLAATEYRVESLDKTPHGLEGVLRLVKEELPEYGPSLSKLRMSVIQESEERLHIKITDAERPRWEIPHTILPTPGVEVVKDPSYEVDVSSPKDQGPFRFRVERPGPHKDVLFDSSSTLLVFKNQYLQFGTTLDPGSLLFGLGESTRRSFQLQPDTTYTLWTRDVPSLNFDKNLYGSHPFYVSVSPTTGRAHGVFFRNSNGMDVTYHRDHRLVYKVIGGVLDLYLFTGPTVTDVVKQYAAVVGYPAMMPYWSLGFHNCRWGYKSVWELKEVVKNYTDAQIPLDGSWVDIDYMDKYKVFTTDPVNFPLSDMQDYVHELHQSGRRAVFIVDPGVAVDPGYSMYDDGMDKDIFIKALDGRPYLGAVWPGPTHFPDFLHPKIDEYWTNHYRYFYDQLPFDGSWIDMNEVCNFCNVHGESQVCDVITEGEDCPQADCLACCRQVDSHDPHDFPPYAIHNAQGDNLGAMTVPLSCSHHSAIKEYDVHNLYGLLESRSTYKAMAEIRGKRPFVLSRSTFAGSGSWAAHWTGDNKSTWEDLQASIRTMLSFSLFNIPMVGADICGFEGDTTQELCTRWIQLGAFYPFSRDHNVYSGISQELYRWDGVAEAARVTLGLRYALLPYLYTLMYRAHIEADMVARPLFVNFPNDPQAYQVDQQFMLGEGLLVTPVVEEGAIAVRGYFPPGIWYTLLGGNDPTITTQGSWIDLPTPLNTIQVHARGGVIFPMQPPALTTTEARKHPFHLMVALDLEGQAQGDLFLDDGDQLDIVQYDLLHYTATDSSVQGRVVTKLYRDRARYPWLEKVVVMGLGRRSGPVERVSLNGLRVPERQWTYDQTSHKLVVDYQRLPLDQAFHLTWE